MFGVSCGDSNLGNHANLTKELGKIMYVTWNEPGEQMQNLLLNEMEAGRGKKQN